MKKMITEFIERLDHEDKALKANLAIVKDAALMNPTRCAIYEFLCLHPCSSVTRIANSMRLLESSVRWHLKRLLAERLVGFNNEGSMVFFPLMLIKPEHVHILKILALDRSRKLLDLIKKKKVLSQNQLSRELNLNIRTVMKYTTELERAGLIMSMSDGKFKRFHLTNLLENLKGIYRKRARYFKEYILRRTMQDGLNPKILLSTPELLKLKLTMGADKKVLTIPLNPFNHAPELFIGSRKKSSQPQQGMFIQVPVTPPQKSR